MGVSCSNEVGQGVPKDTHSSPPSSADTAFLPCLGNLLSHRNLLLQPQSAATAAAASCATRPHQLTMAQARAPEVFSGQGCATMLLQHKMWARRAEALGILGLSRGRLLCQALGLACQLAW